MANDRQGVGTLSEHDKYVAMWSFDAYRSHSPGERLVTYALERIINPGSSIIDFGCGTGRATAKLGYWGCSVLGVDFAENCLDADINIPFLVADLTRLPKLSAEYGFCCDVMEHIPTDKVDDVLRAISGSVEAAFFSIALHADAAGRLIGEKLHMTVESAEWWKEKLKQHFQSVECDDKGHMLIAICRCPIAGK